MNNLYQALSTFIKNAELAHESGDEWALKEALTHLNTIRLNLKKEVEQTTTAPIKLVLITYYSHKDELIPYSLEALEFISTHLDSIEYVRILELRNL
tara:strand:- start:168 stop:458 length:291 start_codon:yes stop_codon:yes gene_type:complete